MKALVLARTYRGTRLAARGLIAICVLSAVMVSTASAHAARPEVAGVAATPVFVPQVAAPCASQGSCQYCGNGGIGTGPCTIADLEYNTNWCAQNYGNLRGNGPKCDIEAQWLAGLENGFFSACDIASIITGVVTGKAVNVLLGIAGWTNPFLGGATWLTGVVGSQIVAKFC